MRLVYFISCDQSISKLASTSRALVVPFKPVAPGGAISIHRRNANGVALFDKLHSKANDHAVFLYAFDLLEIDGEDLRPVPLEQRKARLRKVLIRRRGGTVYSEHLDGDGAIIFQHACRLGLEGVVSKRRDLPYRSGRAKSWLKIKNPKSPAALRIEDGTF
jgi:bifunctional non-homologous end joining protein LigD